MTVNKLKKTLSVLLIAAFMLSAAGCSMIDYKKAEKLKNDGDYAAAQEMYIALGDYKDSAELADECGYQLAKAAYDSKDYETAAGLFDKLGSYNDSAELKQDCDDHILTAKLVGKWVTGKADMAEFVQSLIDEALKDDDFAALASYCSFDDCGLVLTAEFTDSGAFTFGADYVAFFDTYLAALKDGFQLMMEDMIQQSLADNGISMEEAEAYYGTSDIDEIFTAVTGMTIGAYFDAVISSYDLTSIYDNFKSFTGVYSVENGNITITIDDESETVAYDSDTDSFSMSGKELIDGEITFTRENA